MQSEGDTTSASVGGAGSLAEALPALATHILAYFEEAATRAQQELATGRPSIGALAVTNTLNSLASQNLQGISQEMRRNLEDVLARPAIARVEALNYAGEREVFYITPGGAPWPAWGSARIASYHSPVGRLAAIRPGNDVEIAAPGGIKSYEVVGRSLLYPARELLHGWDSRNTVVEALVGPPLTVLSLRALLRAPVSEAQDALALLEQALRQGSEAENVYEGLRRTVLERIGIRTRPVLDEYQDEIFRLPLNRRLAILGPPGTGKTTTLIRRLGQKLDPQALVEELPLIDRTTAGRKGHGESWLMFSPTELLRLYLREAFNRERVAASDAQIRVWDEFRRDVARNRLGILRSANARGGMLREDLESLTAEALDDQVRWFEDFDGWQKQTFWAELKEHANRLAASPEPEVAGLSARLTRIVEAGAHRDGAAPFVEFRAMSAEVGARAAKLQEALDLRLKTAFALEMQKDGEVLDRLLAFVRTLGEATDDADDPDLDEEEEEAAPRTRADVEEAFETYLRAMRAQARALASGRRLGARTRHGRIVEWLGDKAVPDAELRAIGASVLVAASLRRLANPMRAYLNGVRPRYGRFRRLRQGEGVWYGKGPYGPMDFSPLEVDAILLAMLRIGRMLLSDARIAGVVDEASITTLQAVRQLFRSQILVDEATDFSPVQLACMGALCDPAADSFLACGDFNQRITRWGSRSDADLKWVFPDIDIRSIRITYRHSSQLNALAHAIARLTDGGHEAASLPDHVENNGVDPVYHGGLAGEALAAWLAARIAEIERLTQSLPSIAVLVNGEARVQPIADALQSALAPHNIQCAACPGGLVKGNDGDVRVFDIEHIKGLEFEAVFFIGVDELARLRPELFEKFLYVGATRAAMYLGLTSETVEPPERLRPLMAAFGTDWA